MNTTTYTHTEAIARDIYTLYQADLYPNAVLDWDELAPEEQRAWIKVADNLLPVLGQHAPGDLAAYTRRKLKETTPSGKNILWTLLGTAALAAAGWLTSLTLTGCGHTIDVSREDGFIICKEGTCLIIKEGHITYGPHPQNTPVTIRPLK